VTGLPCVSPQQDAADSPAIVSPMGDVPPPISGLAPSMMHTLLSSKSPPFPPTISRGISASSSLSATTPNTTSSNQSSPFHYAEFQNDVGSLQRRLSQERRRRSSAQSVPRPFERSGSISAEESESRNQSRVDTLKAPDGSNTAQEERDGLNVDEVDTEHSGMDHLRDARQELQAVIEEVVDDVFAARAACDAPGKTTQIEGADTAATSMQEDAGTEDEPTQLGFQDDIVVKSANTESALVSMPPSPTVSRAMEAQKNPPLTFEDLVRHRRNSSSASGQAFPCHPSRSGPGSPVPYSTRSRVGSTSEGVMDSFASRTKQVYGQHPSPPACRDEHVAPEVNQLTMMRRGFSGESRSASPEVSPLNGQDGDSRVIPHDMMVRGPIAPDSILRTRDGVDFKHADYAAATEARAAGRPAEGDEVHDLGSRIEDIRLAARTDDRGAFRPTSSVAALSAEKQYRSRSNSRSMPPRDASPESEQPPVHDTHLWDSVWPSAAVMNTHPAASGQVPYPKPITEARNTLTPRLPMHSRTMSMGLGHGSAGRAHLHPMPMIHSLSFPAAAPQPTPPPFTSPTSGVPLSFSAAMSQPATPCPWPQHPSARRGSIASLGVWPLKRDTSTGKWAEQVHTGSGSGNDENRGEKNDIMEEGEDDVGNDGEAEGSSIGDEAAVGDVSEVQRDGAGR
jgi:hypothetical protein